MNFINKKILIICFLLLIITNSINANTIIFKLNNIIYTSEDLEKRISYVRLKNGTIDTNKNQIRKEYINALIFNEFGNNKIKIKKSLIENYYNDFFNQYQNMRKEDVLYSDFFSITYEEILLNLKIEQAIALDTKGKQISFAKSLWAANLIGEQAVFLLSKK